MYNYAVIKKSCFEWGHTNQQD